MSTFAVLQEGDRIIDGVLKAVERQMWFGIQSNELISDAEIRERVAKGVLRIEDVSNNLDFPVFGDLQKQGSWIFSILHRYYVLAEREVRASEGEKINLIVQPGEACTHYLMNKNDPKHVNRFRDIIHQTLIDEGLAPKDGMLTKPDNRTLRRMFELYDEYFYNGQLGTDLQGYGYVPVFEWNSRFTSTGGRCDMNYRKCTLKIQISTQIILGSFLAGEKSLRTNGLTCDTRLRCVQLVFEHEMIHAVVDIVCHKEGRGREKAEHGPRFKKLALRTFGHTDYRHDLLGFDAEETENVQRARDDASKQVERLVRVGSRIKVQQNAGGDVLNGLVESIFGKQLLSASVASETWQKQTSRWRALPMWAIIEVDGKKITPKYGSVYVKIQDKISKDLPVDQRKKLVRKYLRNRKLKDITVKYRSGGRVLETKVTSTRGTKNATTMWKGVKTMVPYENIFQVGDTVIQ